MNNLDPRRVRWVRARMGVLCGLMGLALGAIVASAWRVQVEDGPAWREIAEKQRQRRLHIEPKRGTIYDRNHTPLAVSIDVPSVSADVGEMLRGIDGAPAQDAKLHDAADRLSKALSLDPAELYARLVLRHRFVWVKRRITEAEADAVRDLGDAKRQALTVHGLAIEGEGHRYYPGRELAGPLLGFVAPDGQGKDGVELAADDELRGKIGEVHGLRDRSGRLIFEGQSDERSLQGNDIDLTIDEGIQHIAERELDGAMRTYETKGGSLAVIDPMSGEILALASSPGYNPNDYTESEVDARRDRVVTDRFEPGSVMKPFMLTGALAAGAVQPTDSINCEHGVYEVGGITIHDTHINDWLTPTQILARSSNIGALKIGLSLGEAALYAAYRRFGFGEPTGVPLPGEPAGLLRPKGRPWYDAETASASFGQGIMVTTLQLAMAMGAIANGSKLLEPILIKKVTGSQGEVVREASVHVRREVAPPSVTRTVAEMLVAVTEDGGTAVEASVPGFRVAGKTSTAQKVDPATGKYSPDKYTAVFVGFVPVDRPRLVVAVVLDEPSIGRYGGDLAGPVFRRVAEASLRYLGVTPSLASANLAPAKAGPDGGDHPPSRPAPLPAAAVGPPPPGSVRVPDATGMPAHEVVVSFSKLGLVPQIEGWGRAVRQNPAPGSPAPIGSHVRVVLEPAS
jgi:cell division protein FtsI (penicillin-binding protein 3)